MQIPSARNPLWKELIRSESEYAFEFLATKIILGRLNLKFRLNNSPEELDRCVYELVAFFEKNSHVPKVQNDLKLIFGEGVRI